MRVDASVRKGWKASIRSAYPNQPTEALALALAIERIESGGAVRGNSCRQGSGSGRVLQSQQTEDPR